MKKHYGITGFMVLLFVFIMIPIDGLSDSAIPLCTNVIIMDSFPKPDNFNDSVHGIAFDGKNLWAACYGGGLIHEMGFDDDGSMLILNSIDAPTNRPTGLTFVGKNLFVGTDEHVNGDESLKISMITTTVMSSIN